MYREIIDKAKPELEKAMDYFRREAAKIRTGQASPSLVEDVLVDVFGQKMPLKQLASISTPERRLIVIQPWDVSYLEPIEKALRQSSLGTSPIADGGFVRIQLPGLTQEYREQLGKLLGAKAEDAREVIRRMRDEVWDAIQTKTRAGAIREDDKFKGKEELQKLVDDYNKKIEELVERKKKEIEAE